MRGYGLDFFVKEAMVLSKFYSFVRFSFRFSCGVFLFIELRRGLF